MFNLNNNLLTKHPPDRSFCKVIRFHIYPSLLLITIRVSIIPSKNGIPFLTELRGILRNSVASFRGSWEVKKIRQNYVVRNSAGHSIEVNYRRPISSLSQTHWLGDPVNTGWMNTGQQLWNVWLVCFQRSMCRHTWIQVNKDDLAGSAVLIF